MEVSEADRHDLYEGLVEKLGRRRAEVFMNLVRTVPWSEVATKADLERMGRKLVMWTASMVIAMAGLAFAAARFV